MFIGPTQAVGHESNWVQTIQTIPGRHWFSCFRFYGPLEPCFDQPASSLDAEAVEAWRREER